MKLRYGMTRTSERQIQLIYPAVWLAHPFARSLKKQRNSEEERKIARKRQYLLFQLPEYSHIVYQLIENDELNNFLNGFGDFRKRSGKIWRHFKQ